LHAAGFRDVRWHQPMLSPAGDAGYGRDYWSTLLDPALLELESATCIDAVPTRKPRFAGDSPLKEARFEPYRRVLSLDVAGFGQSLEKSGGQQLEPLRIQLGHHECHAGEVAARPGEASDEAATNGALPEVLPRKPITGIAFC
jgi:hypothetical protein